MEKNEISSIAEYLTSQIKLKKNKLQKNYLIILTGIPGSGKTILSEELEKNFNFIRISTDKIKEYLIKKRYNFLLKDLFAIQEKIFKLLMKKKVNVISDSNSDLTKYRNKLKKLSKNYHYIPISVYIKVNLETAYQRVIKRKNMKESKRIYKKIKKFNDSLQIPNEAFILNNNYNKKQFIEEVKKIPLK